MAEVAAHASCEQEEKYVGSAKPDMPSKWDQTMLHSGMMQQQQQGLNLTRKEKRKCLKKLKRKAVRRETAIKERALEEAWLNDPEEQRRLQLQEQAEAQESERARILFADSERIWLQNYTRALEEEQARQRQQQEEELRRQQEEETRKEEQEDWEYVEEGPAEIIWKGNEIIVKKRQVKVPKRKTAENTSQESEQPFSNPLPPQHAAYSDYKKNLLSNTGHKVFDGIEDQIPNFGTEQDKAHCPFHIKTGVCRFGTRCSRAHFYPDKSCTLLMKSMYYGPGLTFEQDEGLEVCDASFLSSLIPHSDEEVALHYFEFYEDVHTEFLKFGELVNFKVCRNASPHLRGNVYVHYQSLDSAIDVYKSLNGRFYGGKQITCEFVGVTKWKVAICGEYLKSRHKTCSRGSTCNFLHCFHNPGGEYDWADWDKPPPRSWIQKMDVLFGSSRASAHDDAQHSRVNDIYSRKHRHTHKASSRRANCHEKDSWSSEETNVNESYSVASKSSSSDDETYITRDGNREKFGMHGSRANKKGSKYSRPRIEKEESSTAGRRHRHRHKNIKHHRQHSVTADQSRRKHGKSYESDNREQSSASNVKKRPSSASSKDDNGLDQRYTKSSKRDSHKHKHKHKHNDKSHTRQRHSSISRSSSSSGS